MGAFADEAKGWNNEAERRIEELAKDERTAEATRAFLATLGVIAEHAWGDVAVPLLVAAGKAALDREARRRGGG